MYLDREDLLVVIPARDEGAHVGAVVSALRGLGYAVCVVDDGSADETARVSDAEGAYVICHDAPRGVSAAVKTGVGLAMRDGFAAVVTMDGDGQHNPAAVPDFEDALRVRDVVLGTRFDRSLDGVPTPKLASNSLGANLASSLVGRACKDVACGMRAFRVGHYPSSCEGLPGYAFPSQMLYASFLRGLDVGWCHVEPSYSPRELAFTRSSEMLALYAATAHYFPGFTSVFRAVGRLIAERRDHVVSLGGDEYYCFALPDRDGYVIQCDERLARFDFALRDDPIGSICIREFPAG